MSDLARKVAWTMLRAIYITIALLFAFMALAMSFLSDGPVPLSVHIAMPAMVLAIFFGIPLAWRLMKNGVPAPAFIQRNQKKALLILVGVYVCLQLVFLMIGSK